MTDHSQDPTADRGATRSKAKTFCPTVCLYDSNVSTISRLYDPTPVRLYDHNLLWYSRTVAKAKRAKRSFGKVKLTVSLSRSAVASLERIGAARLEAGEGRRQINKSALLEEAIGLLRR